MKWLRPCWSQPFHCDCSPWMVKSKKTCRRAGSTALLYCNCCTYNCAVLPARRHVFLVWPAPSGWTRLGFKGNYYLRKFLQADLNVPSVAYWYQPVFYTLLHPSMSFLLSSNLAWQNLKFVSSEIRTPAKENEKGVAMYKTLALTIWPRGTS